MAGVSCRSYLGMVHPFNKWPDIGTLTQPQSKSGHFPLNFNLHITNFRLIEYTSFLLILAQNRYTGFGRIWVVSPDN